MSDKKDYTQQRAAEFAQRLRTARERRRLTQAQLGGLAGLSPAAISQLESGERKPNFATLVGLSKALGTTPDALLGVADKETDEPELKALFRKLEGLSSNDVAAVRAYVELLKQQKKS